MGGSDRPGATLAYIRISTVGQEEGMGLDVQRNAIVAYAAFNGFTIDAWHQDTESGAKESRAGLAAIRAAVQSGQVKRLLVYRLDRIARDTLLSETVYRELTRAGCTVSSVSEAMIDESPSGNLMRVILAGFAEYERAVIALRTMSGRKAKVSSAGTFHGGGVPYGYRAIGTRKQPGHGVLAIDESHAAAVRRAFALLDGTTLPFTQIADTLNAEGYRTARGTPFTGKQVRRILDRRKVYAAILPTTPSIALAPGVTGAQPAILESA